MTPKEIAFAENYLSTVNTTDAATKAGYSDLSARQIGYENLTKPYIQNYIRERSEDRLERLWITQERVLAEIVKIAFANVTNKRKSDNLPKNSKTPSKLLLKGFCVPRAGVEPARLAALVFETNASTDSATWALNCFILMRLFGIQLA